MTIGITWSVNFMVSYPQVGPFENVVFQVNYSCTASDGTFSESTVGECNVKLDGSVSFTPYEELTEDQVVAWVKTSIGEQEVAYIEKQTAQQLADNYYKANILPNPWE